MNQFLEQSWLAIGDFNLPILFVATVAGIAIGATPGLTVNMAVALAVPLTMSMSLATALTVILALYVSGIFGGSVSAILMNTPGTPAAAATVLDGYPLSRRGLAKKALSMALLASVCGGLFSVLVLTFLARQLAGIALMFGPFERASLLVFALTLIGSLSGASLGRGLIGAGIGLLIGSVGSDPMTGAPRFTFGLLDLEDGFSFIALLIGLFAISEILTLSRAAVVAQDDDSIGADDSEQDRLTWPDIRRSRWAIAQSSLIGTFIGILPGIGATVSSFLGYAAARRTSSDPESFGSGAIEGVAAAEAANNAVSGAALIPLLALSIPGDAVTAVLSGALLVHGVQTGPFIFTQHVDSVYLLYNILILANLAMAVCGFVMMGLFRRFAAIPASLLMPAVLVLCVVGTFTYRSSVFDLYAMLAFGLMGVAMRRLSIPVAVVVISFLLARPLEEALFQSAVSAQGNWSSIIAHPIACVFLALAVVSVGLTIVENLRRASAFTN